MVALSKLGILYEVSLSTGEVRSGALAVDVATAMVADATSAYVLAWLPGEPDKTQLLKVSRADFSTELFGGVVNPSALQLVDRGLLLGSWDVAAKQETLSLVSPSDGAATDLFGFASGSQPTVFADEGGIFVSSFEQPEGVGTARWLSWDGAKSALVGEARWVGKLGDPRWAGIVHLVVAGPWVLVTVDPAADGWPDPIVGAIAFCTPSEAR